ncbi:MAG TPA: DMT family transporter [Flavobacteriaceae bacterium]|nr:DMT family transporter [Flavobacteriaceae bacterium]
MKNSVLWGSLLVAIGASSYGVLTTFVRMAYAEGFSPTEVVFSQYLLGFFGLVLLVFFGKKRGKHPVKPTKAKIYKLILAGTSFGLTTVFYYFAVRSISVSIGIVLLMQSVWMGIALEAFLQKRLPSKIKLFSVAVILMGTFLATNLFLEDAEINPQGIGFGLLAAVSFTAAIFASNKLAVELPALVRSKWLAFGGLITVSLVAFPSLITNFNPAILYSWGLVLGIFGSILPPVFLTLGMPKIKLGIGAIITSMELPVAMLAAYFLLGEKITLHQWIGVALILVAIMGMNLMGLLKKEKGK